MKDFLERIYLKSVFHLEYITSSWISVFYRIENFACVDCVLIFNVNKTYYT